MVIISQMLNKSLLVLYAPVLQRFLLIHKHSLTLITHHFVVKFLSNSNNDTKRSNLTLLSNQNTLKRLGGLHVNQGRDENV